MSEEVVHISSVPPLFGIRTVGRAPRRRTVVVAANSGIVHRIGANRTTVLLARHLAALGYDVLRFDLSGIGDGPTRTDGLSWERSSPLELRTAVEAAMRVGEVDRAVLYGNCGGAAKSFWAAQRTPAVRGLLLTNPPPHPADPRFGDEVQLSAHGNLLPAGAVPDPAGDLDDLLAGGVRALFVFAAGDVGEQAFAARLAQRVRPHLDAGSLQVARVPATNHTLASSHSRQCLLDLAGRWMVETFPESVEEAPVVRDRR